MHTYQCVKIYNLLIIFDLVEAAGVELLRCPGMSYQELTSITDLLLEMRFE